MALRKRLEEIVDSGVNFFWRDRITALIFAAAAVLLCIIWLIVVRHIQDPESLEVLQYSVYFGVTEFGPAKNLYRIPSIGLIVLVGNTFLAYLLHQRHRVYSVLLLSVALAIQLTLIIPLIALLRLETPF